MSSKCRLNGCSRMICCAVAAPPNFLEPFPGTFPSVSNPENDLETCALEHSRGSRGHQCVLLNKCCTTVWSRARQTLFWAFPGHFSFSVKIRRSSRNMYFGTFQRVSWAPRRSPEKVLHNGVVESLANPFLRHFSGFAVQCQIQKNVSTYVFWSIVRGLVVSWSRVFRVAQI